MTIHSEPSDAALPLRLNLDINEAAVEIIKATMGLQAKDGIPAAVFLAGMPRPIGILASQAAQAAISYCLAELRKTGFGTAAAEKTIADHMAKAREDLKQENPGDQI